MAGLLTFPRSALPSQPSQRPVASLQADPVFQGITAAGTVPDSHRIPLHRCGSGQPITINFRRKSTAFSTNHQQNRKNIQKNKKERSIKNH